MKYTWEMKLVVTNTQNDSEKTVLYLGLMQMLHQLQLVILVSANAEICKSGVNETSAEINCINITILINKLWNYI